MSGLLEGAWPYVEISAEALQRLHQLAEEDSASIEDTASNLILEADALRHTEERRGEASVRVKCENPRCVETEDRKYF